MTDNKAGMAGYPKNTPVSDSSLRKASALPSGLAGCFPPWRGWTVDRGQTGTKEVESASKFP